MLLIFTLWGLGGGEREHKFVGDSKTLQHLSCQTRDNFMEGARYLWALWGMVMLVNQPMDALQTLPQLWLSGENTVIAMVEKRKKKDCHTVVHP